MSQENVEIVRRVLGAMSLEASQAGTIENFVQRLAPDVEFEEDQRFPEADTYRGRTELLRYFSQFAAQFEQYVFMIEELLDGGEDTVLVCLRARGRGKDSSAEFDFRAGWLFTVRDGQVGRIKAYLDREEALEAVGLSE